LLSLASQNVFYAWPVDSIQRIEPLSRPGDYNAQNIAEFRKNHGKVGGYFEGAPLLLLNTIGRRSNRLHVCPVMYLKDGERFLVFASKGGADKHPDWYFNLKAHPDFQIEIGDERIDIHADEVTGGERDALYNRQAALYPRFGDYQRKTKRIIPVIALSKRK
jgi:deazaflavin-dependent oxidoreductase (nitroreductase family)